MSQETPPPSYSAATKPDKGEKGKEENEPKSMLGGLFGGLFGGFGGGGGVPQAAGGGLFGAPAQGDEPQFCCGAPPPMTPMKKKKGKSSSRSRVGGAVDIRRIGYDVERDRDAELVGVIVTVCAGSSYDNLFTAIRQQGADGTRTAVWKVNPSALRGIVAALEASALHSGSAEQTDEQTADASAETSAKAHPTRPTGAPATDLDTMVGEIMSVDPASVAFNWECCSGCSAAGFGSEADTHAALSAAEYAVSHGHMAMFSDFSLMALIKDWRDAVLGPNPFRQFGSFSGSMELKFDPPTLEASPSAQLQTLGKLAEEGTATVHAMGGTIAYTVDAAGAKAGAAAGKYALEVLTVAESFSDGTAIPRAAITRTGAHTGAAGHVVLKYEVGGGTLLTSCGHWIELSKLDTTEEALLRITEQELGEVESARMRAAFESSPTKEMRSTLLQTMSSECVQRQSCAMYSPRAPGGVSDSDDDDITEIEAPPVSIAVPVKRARCSKLPSKQCQSKVQLCTPLERHQTPAKKKKAGGKAKAKGKAPAASGRRGRRGGGKL